MRPATTRRRFLAGVGTTVAVAGCTDDGEGGPTPDGATVALEPVADGFAAPIAIADPPGVDRRYVADQAGQVVALGPDGKQRFLDLTDRMVAVGDGYTERGLLGLAPHPSYPEDPRVFVRYSAPPREGTPSGDAHTFVLASVRAATLDRADPESERTLLAIPQPQSNHNAGSIAFGPDGYLYVGVGDGGGSGDRGPGHVEDWYDAVAGGNGQDVQANLLGSVLRIDVDDRTGERPYAIPADNPLVGRPGLDEIYAWGFRNPWRLSFDGDRLLVADVGESRYEEVNVVRAGGNYGWNVREGPTCFDADQCPAETPDGEPLRDPVVAYPHSRDGERVGLAVVGGYVYRGDAVDALAGRYVFGDWSRSFGAPSGTVFAATPTGEGSWPMEQVRIAGTDDGQLGRYLLAFGREPAGELYLCTSRSGSPSGDSGAVHRLVAADGA